MRTYFRIEKLDNGWTVNGWAHPVKDVYHEMNIYVETLKDALKEIQAFDIKVEK